MLTLFIERLAARTVNRIRETGAPRAIIRTHAGYRTVNVEDWEQLLADRRIRMDDVVGIYDTSATTAQIADDLEAMV